MFCHIEKCGGTTLIAQLRYFFGASHIDIIPLDYGWANISTQKDIGAALRRIPFALSVAGHSIKPYLKYDQCFAKYTLLRDPINRYVSDYLHDKERRGFQGSFEVWMQHSSRWNYQTKFLSGGNDLEKAQSILAENFEIFGFTERYDDFMFLLSLRFGLPLFSSAAANKSKATIEITSKLLEMARERNALDIDLYAFAQKLYTERRPTWSSYQTGIRCRPFLRGRFLNKVTRNLYYKPSLGMLPAQLHSLPINAVNAAVAEATNIATVDDTTNPPKLRNVSETSISRSR